MDTAHSMQRLEAEVRRLGEYQLHESRSLAADQVRVKRITGDEDSLVTDIDLESERRLHAFVQREFPEHSFLGEETGHHVRDPAHYWIVDPIDGTTNFTHDIPYWGPSVAYWHLGQPVLGLVYFPALDCLFKAIHGGGAMLNDTPIHTSDVEAYSSLTMVALHSRSHYSHHLRSRAKVRVLGSIIANMCFTARGTFAAMHGRGRLWDVAAGILILQEAGAVIDCAPDCRGIDPSRYGHDGNEGALFSLQARANTTLPPLGPLLAPTTTVPCG